MLLGQPCAAGVTQLMLLRCRCTTTLDYEAPAQNSEPAASSSPRETSAAARLLPYVYHHDSEHALAGLREGVLAARPTLRCRYHPADAPAPPVHNDRR